MREAFLLLHPLTAIRISYWQFNARAVFPFLPNTDFIAISKSSRRVRGIVTCQISIRFFACVNQRLPASHSCSSPSTLVLFDQLGLSPWTYQHSFRARFRLVCFPFFKIALRHKTILSKTHQWLHTRSNIKTLISTRSSNTWRCHRKTRANVSRELRMCPSIAPHCEFFDNGWLRHLFTLL